METISIVGGIVGGLVMLALLFKPFFGDAEGFFECVRFWFTPDILSWLAGERADDWWAEMKLGFWLFCGAAAGYGVYVGLTALLGA